jgi:hypothetical protein
MRTLLFAAALISGSVLAADFTIDPGASVANGTLKVEPVALGPAGAAVRYEIRTTRESGAGTSDSSQSGEARLGPDGAAKLASTSVSVSPRDRYRVQVRLLEKGRVVAEEEVRYPD